MKINQQLIKIGYRMTRLAWLKSSEDKGQVWVTYIYPDAIHIAPYAMFNSKDLEGFYIKGDRDRPAKVWTPSPADLAATDWEIVGNPVEEQHKHLLEAEPVAETRPDLNEISIEEPFILDNADQVTALIKGMRLAQKTCFQANVKSGWWTDLKTGESLQNTDGTGIKRNTGELMTLIHSEISEAYEGYRKNLMDDHLTHRKMEEVELADTIYRIFDLAESKGYDLGTTLIEKAVYNLNRADHKPENRRLANGKKS